MKRTTNFKPHNVIRENRADGTILLRSAEPLSEVANTTGDWLHSWAQQTPDNIFIAERHGAGWRAEIGRAHV